MQVNIPPYIECMAMEFQQNPTPNYSERGVIFSWKNIMKFDVTYRCFQLIPKYAECMDSWPTLPETNSSPLKMDGWNTTFLLGFGLFSGAFAVRFREGKFRSWDFDRVNWIPVGTSFSIIIMVQWKTPLNERNIILEIHPFSTELWLWEEEFPHQRHPQTIWANWPTISKPDFFGTCSTSKNYCPK